VCLIVDANAAGTFLCRRSAVTDWLLGKHGNPRLVVGGKLRDELIRLTEARRLLVQLHRAGRLRTEPAQKVAGEVPRALACAPCKSNDSHILALARLTGARTLATFDENLIADFRNPALIHSPRGSVYRLPAKHGHLLRHTPSSCGIRPSSAHRKNR
jgi:predicted nucleic acid-binding protein